MKNTSKGKRAVLYIRASADDRDRGADAQAARLRRYAVEQGLEVTKAFQDQHDRTGFLEMVAFIREHECARWAIIADGVDRLYHRLEDVSCVDDLGVDLHFVAEGRGVSEGMSSITKLQHNLLVLVSRHLAGNPSALVSTTDDEDGQMHLQYGSRSSGEMEDHESQA